MEALRVLDLFTPLNPKPPYECEAIRKNPDLIKLEHEEPDLLQDSYSKYVMKSGITVYTREIEIEAPGWYEDIDYETELEIISKEDHESLPVRSDGALAKFEKVLQQKVWESRKNGINHYHPWHEPVYHIDSMFEKVPVPQLHFTPPYTVNHF